MPRQRLQTRFAFLLLLGVCVWGCVKEAPGPSESKSHPVVPSSPQTSLGAIEGQVLFTGKVPLARKISTTDGGVIEHNDLVVDAKSSGLRDVVAVLENAPARPLRAKSSPVVVDQRGMIFVPRVVGVQQGQAVRFENSDLCNHSVMAASMIEANQFNIFVSPNQPHEHVFVFQKHPVQIGCSLHGWMRAWVYIVPHPWFAVSDAQGKFRIEAVPPGKYTLWLRHADTGLQKRQDLEVQGGMIIRANVEWQEVGK
jgi:plastocyanin